MVACVPDDACWLPCEMLNTPHAARRHPASAVSVHVQHVHIHTHTLYTNACDPPDTLHVYVCMLMRIFGVTTNPKKQRAWNSWLYNMCRVDSMLEIREHRLCEGKVCLCIYNGRHPRKVQKMPPSCTVCICKCVDVHAFYVCACMYVCMYVYTYMHKHTHTHTQTHIVIHMSLHMSWSVHTYRGQEVPKVKHAIWPNVAPSNSL